MDASDAVNGFAGLCFVVGKCQQFAHGFRKFGWEVKWADINDPSSFEAAIFVSFLGG